MLSFRLASNARAAEIFTRRPATAKRSDRRMIPGFREALHGFLRQMVLAILAEDGAAR